MSGEPIPKERLKAIPWARERVEYKVGGSADAERATVDRPTGGPLPTPARRPAGPAGWTLIAGHRGASWSSLDQLTKWWAVDRLGGRIIDVVGSLRFNLVYNTGRGVQHRPGRDLGPCDRRCWPSCVVVRLSLLYTGRRPASGPSAAGLVAGGALGNLVDRAFRGDAGFLHGAVVDFIDLQWWPVFNVADAARRGRGTCWPWWPTCANERQPAAVVRRRRSPTAWPANASTAWCR